MGKKGIFFTVFIINFFSSIVGMGGNKQLCLSKKPVDYEQDIFFRLKEEKEILKAIKYNDLLKKSEEQKQIRELVALKTMVDNKLSETALRRYEKGLLEFFWNEIDLLRFRVYPKHFCYSKINAVDIIDELEIHKKNLKLLLTDSLHKSDHTMAILLFDNTLLSDYLKSGAPTVYERVWTDVSWIEIRSLLDRVLKMYVGSVQQRMEKFKNELLDFQEKLMTMKGDDSVATLKSDFENLQKNFLALENFYYLWQKVGGCEMIPIAEVWLEIKSLFQEVRLDYVYHGH